MASPDRDAGLVHKSAHPSLPPADPRQVVQYLLAKNYHLTALELLVEAQQAGHGDDVRDLEAFFSDQERFPPEELARHQPAHAFDLQAAGKERESRLQMAEYELRLAKEDLAEMARKLAQAQERQQQQPVTGNGAAGPTSPAARAPSASLGVVGVVGEGAKSTADGDAAHPAQGGVSRGTPSAAPTPAEQRELNAAVFAHLLRQGLVTTAMTMEEEYGGSLRPASHPGHAAAQEVDQWDLWTWRQAATSAQAAAASAATAAAAGGPTAAAAGATLLTLAPEFELDLDPKPLEADRLAAASAEELREQLLAADRRLGETREKARAALGAAQQQLAALRAAAATVAGAGAGSGTPRVLPSPTAGPFQPPLLAEDAAVLDLLDLGSSVASSLLPEAASSAAGPAATPSTTAAATPARALPLSLSPAESPDTARPARASPEPQAAAGPLGRLPWLTGVHSDIDPEHHTALQGLLGRLCEALPRLVPNLNIKSRMDALPLIVAAAKTTPEWPIRQQLLVAIFNLVHAPDHQQRQAIIESCLELCRAFGSGWAASELVQLCARQANSPSSERRTLVAEALGAAVGVVDAGTQAHVLLTQLTQLAKDRMEQVREAACHSLARLVPRLPFSRSYYSPLEALLLPLATDGSEAVHAAALSYLVPALLTWQPQDHDSVLVSTCLARVLLEISAQVRLIEQQQPHIHRTAAAATSTPPAAEVAAAPPTASPGSGSGGSSFGGTFLRYSLPGSTPPAVPQVAGPDAGAGGASAGEHPLAPQPSHPSHSSPAPPPPPPQPVTFGRRTFPSLSHLTLYQLLGLYCGLAPALRHAALRSMPTWAERPPAPSGSTTPDKSATTGPRSAASAAAPATRPWRHSGIHHRRGSSGALSTSATSSSSFSLTDPRPPNGTRGARPAHRRTSSQPVSLGSHTGPGGIATSPLGGLPPLPPTPPAAGTGVVGDVSRLLSNGDPTATTAATGQELDRASPSSPRAVASGGEDGDGEDDGAENGGGDHAEEEVADGGSEGSEEAEAERAEQDMALAAWAVHPSHNSWKTLEWVMQHVFPELLRLVACVGPTVPEAFEVRRQAAGAVAATCGALGAPFTNAAVLPVFLVASGTGATAAGNAVTAGDYDAPIAVRDVCAAAQPRTLEALRTARQCVLPVLLVAVLPAAAQLRSHLEQLMGSAHELRHRWLLEALPDYTVALTFACTLRPELVPDVVRLFEDLLSGNTSAAAGSGDSTSSTADVSAGAAAPASSPASQLPAPSGSGGPASTAVGLCCAALARALVPLATLEMASRRLLPGLMALMSYGEPELQRACVGVLAELGLRFRGDGPRVSEQVLVVYDSLLEQGGHGVQLEVLAAGTALAAAAAPSAAVSAAAAAQVEWLLMAVQAVAARLLAPATATGHAGNGGGGLVSVHSTPEQQRAVAAQLLAALRAVAPYDLRLPRLLTNLTAALDAIQRCKALLPDPQQQAALAALHKERPTGPSAAGASISSSPGPSHAASTPPRQRPTHGSFTLASGQATAGAAASAATAHGPGSAAAAHQQAGGQSHLGSFLHYSSGAAAGSPATGAGVGAQSADGQGAGGQLRSRFDALKMRLLKRGNEPPVAGQQQTGTGTATAALAERPKEAFFSDDEGE